MIPLVPPQGELTPEQLERGARTIALPGIGVDGQTRLRSARVLVIGAGGLGSPALQYLAAAGVGTIGVVDFDAVDLSNLQRQVIHAGAKIGEAKVASAARYIASLDPSIDVIQHDTTLDSSNAITLFGDYDVILDGSDNFATRYLANDAAAILRKPYVWGSVLRYDAQVSVFWEGAPDGASVDYRDLHPVPPEPGAVLSCGEAGVLGSVCGTVGSMMATEVIKLVTGVGDTLLGRVQILDSLRAEWRQVTLRRSPERRPVSELIDYEEFCGVEIPDRALEVDAVPEGWRLVDVREPYEHEQSHLENDELLPLGTLLDDPGRVKGPVVVYCASGVRSNRAARALIVAGVEARSLRGGLSGR
ncbi:MAG TPA: molybdopterin-synthase adenylyltransferase MoeB [Galbitalea sp.]|jgi:adenylyltransferase/sulfurtransferase